MLIYYIRHGDPLYNPDCLTEKGHLQAQALAKRLASANFDQMYVSPLIRARQTAEPTEIALNKKATVIDWLSEGYAWERMCHKRDDGSHTWFYQSEYHCKLMASKQIAQLGKEWYLHPDFVNTRAKEGVLGMREHVTEFMHQLGYDYDLDKQAYLTDNVNDNRRIAIFAHEGIGMLFLSTLLDIPYPTFCTRFYMGHTGVTVIEITPNNRQAIPHVLQMSSDSHLYKEGTLTEYQNRIKL